MKGCALFVTKTILWGCVFVGFFTGPVGIISSILLICLYIIIRDVVKN